MSIRNALVVTSFLAVASILWAGCSSGPDNAGACKDYIDHVSGLSCVKSAGTSAQVDNSFCDAYNNASCDETDYFDCLSSHYKCDGDTLDTTEFGKISECKPCGG